MHIIIFPFFFFNFDFIQFYLKIYKKVNNCFNLNFFQTMFVQFYFMSLYVTVAFECLNLKIKNKN